MGCDCAGVGLDEVFGEKRARRDARRYRRRGLPRRARRLLEGLHSRFPLDGARLLEIGAGVGGLAIDALRRLGAERARTVDASPAAVARARLLAAESGVADRLEVTLGDFAGEAEPGRYDVVVLDRVVCCYPDWRGLLDAAAHAAERAIALSYPRETWWTRAAVAGANGVQRLLRRRFRIWVHPVDAMQELLREEGFASEVVGYDGPWELTIAVRSADQHRPAGVGATP